MSSTTPGSVVAVHRGPGHDFTKPTVEEIRLVAGLGVEGDAHAGATVQHRSRVRKDPSQPNLRQVHLIADELLTEVRGRGFAVGPGDLGENITTQHLDLLALPTGTVLRFERGPLVALTGLRNPCAQIDRFAPGLRAEVRSVDADGNVVRRAGVMGVVVLGGAVRAGDRIELALPPTPHERLAYV